MKQPPAETIELELLEEHKRYNELIFLWTMPHQIKPMLSYVLNGAVPYKYYMNTIVTKATILPPLGLL